MRKLILGLALAAVVTPAKSQAQMTLDMTRVTCADYLAMTPDHADHFSAWMSGWFSQRFGHVSVGMNDFARNIAAVKQWCGLNPQRTVMAALEQSPPQPGPPGGQVTIDMSLITCKQYLAGDTKAQEMIANWMGGYFRASKSQPVFDFKRSAGNRKAVSAYCRKNGAETLMSAIQKRAR